MARLGTMTTPTRSLAQELQPAFALRALERARHLFAQEAPVSEELVLRRDGVRSVHVGKQPMELAVLEGSVLVTCEGDAHDHVVEAGESFRSERAGHHVVAALRPSRVWIR